MVYTGIYMSVVNNMEIKKYGLLTLSGAKKYIGQIQPSKTKLIVFCTICKGSMIKLSNVKD